MFMIPLKNLARKGLTIEPLGVAPPVYSHCESTGVAQYSAMPLKRGQYSHKSSQQTPHSSPVRASYGVSFVSSMSDLCSAVVIAVL